MELESFMDIFFNSGKCDEIPSVEKLVLHQYAMYLEQ